MVELKPGTIRARIRRGWPLDRARSAPPLLRRATIVGDKKLCRACGRLRCIKTDFARRNDRRPGELQPRCRKCDGKRVKKDIAKIRRRVIHMYSRGKMKCALCPERRFDVLDLDHVHGSGNKHRRIYKSAKQEWMRALKKPDFSKYRVLCKNCNWLAYLRRIRKA